MARAPVGHQLSVRLLGSFRSLPSCWSDLWNGRRGCSVYTVYLNVGIVCREGDWESRRKKHHDWDNGEKWIHSKACLLCSLASEVILWLEREWFHPEDVKSVYNPNYPVREIFKLKPQEIAQNNPCLSQALCMADVLGGLWLCCSEVKQSGEAEESDSKESGVGCFYTSDTH